MKNLPWILGIIILFAFQLAISQSFSFAPNLVLIFLCIMLRYFSIKRVLAASILAGVLLDYYSGSPDGIMIASVIAAVSVSYFLSQSFFHEHLHEFMLGFYVIFSSIFFVLTYLLLNQVLVFFNWSTIASWSQLWGWEMLIRVILNLIFIYPVLWFYEFVIFAQNRLLNKHDTI